jgi:hypothetical protein
MKAVVEVVLMMKGMTGVVDDGWDHGQHVCGQGDGRRILVKEVWRLEA